MSVLQLSFVGAQMSAEKRICLLFLLLPETANDITKSAETDFLGSTDSLAFQDPPSKLVNLYTFLFTPRLLLSAPCRNREFLLSIICSLLSFIVSQINLSQTASLPCFSHSHLHNPARELGMEMEVLYRHK